MVMIFTMPANTERSRMVPIWLFIWEPNKKVPRILFLGLIYNLRRTFWECL